MPEGHWRHNQYFELSLVAYEQGVDIEKFRKRSVRAQANALATRRVKTTFEAYDHHLEMKKIKARRPRTKG